jgi:hypothetical protein
MGFGGFHMDPRSADTARILQHTYEVEQISPGQAREFWADPSQREPGETVNMLPSVGVDYFACRDLCLAFRQGPYPGVYMVDLGAKPEGWGYLKTPACLILRAFADSRDVDCVMAWTKTTKRAVVSFAKRVGFREVGMMTDPALTILEWRP